MHINAPPYRSWDNDQRMSKRRLPLHADAPPVSGPSKGLGDTIAKITHATYLDALVDLYGDVTGSGCNCDLRRRKLNRLVPYRRRKR